MLRRCTRVSDKGCYVALLTSLSVALNCLWDPGEISMKSLLLAMDNNVHVNGNQCVSRNCHHMSQQRNDKQRNDKQREERHNGEGLKQTKSRHV